MTERPVVSVIMVSYSTRDLTIRAVKALGHAATSVPFEIVVVDNASTDDSADAIEAAVPGARVLRLRENIGFGRAVNAGADVARGDWLLLLNPDTEPVGDLLAAFLAAAHSPHGQGMYVGRTLRADGTDDGKSIHGLPSLWSTACFALGASTAFPGSQRLNPAALPGVDRTVASFVPAVSGCALFIERSLFAKLEGFRPDYFMYSEDIDLSARAAALGVRPLLVPDAKVVHVGGASSTSGGKRVMVLRGQTTYFRLHWSPARAFVGRALLLCGIGLRAAGSRLTGRATYWREAWQRRREWLPGWPSPTR
jgi:GT2 family glycosyltransferase